MPIEPPDAPTPTPGPWGLEEFRQLRATVGARSTVRVLVSLLTFVSWAGLATLVIDRGAPPRGMLLPLAILWVGFELVAGLHIGVERIGRFLQVFYEGGAATPKWETAIALFGQSEAAKAASVRPLLAREFVAAALGSIGLGLWAPAALGSGLGPPLETILVLVAHIAFVWRVLQVDRQTRGQRARDEAAFQSVARTLRR
jgi:hypothetical protein